MQVLHGCQGFLMPLARDGSLGHVMMRANLLPPFDLHGFDVHHNFRSQ